MTKEEFQFALAKCDHALDFMALASNVRIDESSNDVKNVRIHTIIKEAFWCGYERSTKSALKAIEYQAKKRK